MAWINMVEENEAEGKLQEIYKKITRRGNSKVPHVLKVQSLNPQVLADHLNLYKTIMFANSNITRKQREMVATVVSAINDCHY